MLKNRPAMLAVLISMGLIPLQGASLVAGADEMRQNSSEDSKQILHTRETGDVGSAAHLGHEEEAQPAADKPPALNQAFVRAPEFDEAVQGFLRKPKETDPTYLTNAWQQQIEMIRKQRHNHEWAFAYGNIQQILDSNAPEEFLKTALLELAFTHQAAEQYPQALKAYAMFTKRYPEDPGIPEVLLRQGLVLRELGANESALAKLHSVMASALTLNMDEFNYYRRLVLIAQTQIADTLYMQGKLDEAADKFSILLKSDNEELDRELTQYKLVLCLSGSENHTQVLAETGDFLARFAGSPYGPHMRYLRARSFQALGRNMEAQEEVLNLLQSEQARNSPEWIEWQKRTGNEVANRLYQEGDYLRSLEIYLNLAKIDTSPEWQLPVYYQAGLSYEHLKQPRRAIEAYARILEVEQSVEEPFAPGLQAIIDMARWRKEFLSWKNEADRAQSRLEELRDRTAQMEKSTP